jgi:predicted DNA-binding protein (UPF0251 family)
MAISLGLAALLVFSFTAVVFADDPPGESDVSPDYCGQGWGAQYGFLAANHEAVGELLGLTPEEIHALRYEGKSLAEIAAAQGVSEDELVAAILAARQEVVQQRVEAGTLTQEQADQMLGVMAQNLHQAVNRTTLGPPEDRGTCGFGSDGQSTWRWGKGGASESDGGNAFGHGSGSTHRFGQSSDSIGQGAGSMHRFGRGR